MGFAADFPVDALLEVFGEPITYAPEGASSIITTGVLDRGVERVIEGAYLSGRVNLLHVAKSAVPSPQRGDQVVIGAEIFVVQAVEADDGLFVTVRVQ